MPSTRRFDRLHCRQVFSFRQSLTGACFGLVVRAGPRRCRGFDGDRAMRSATLRNVGREGGGAAAQYRSKLEQLPDVTAGTATKKRTVYQNSMVQVYLSRRWAKCRILAKALLYPNRVSHGSAITVLSDKTAMHIYTGALVV